MNINIKVTNSEPVPWEKIEGIIINVVKVALEKSNDLKIDVSVTECIRTLDGKVVGWVELTTE